MENQNIQIDIFAILIFLGVAQGIFLSMFFLGKSKTQNPSNKILGILLLIFSILLADIFLGYTGYMQSVIFLNDVSEPVNFAIGPLIYLYTVTKTDHSLSKKHFLHFVPAFLYGIYSLNFTLQSDSYKLLAYSSAWHKNLNLPNVETFWNPDPWKLQEYISELVIVSVAFYIILSAILISKELRRENLSFLSSENPNLYWLRKLLFTNTFVITVVIVSKLYFSDDLGDYLIASTLSLVIYSISFDIIRKSVFFNEPASQKKYQKSSLSNSIRTDTVTKLNTLMETEKPFLSNSFSMPDLARKLNVSTHHLSQILNEDFKQSFSDYISVLRIEEAKRILSAPERSVFKIEEISERVGYNSKSAFNTTFKKLTGKTPSQFRDGK